MRYPKTTFMTRTFKLAEKLGITMIKYIRGNDNAFLSYNQISVTKTQNNQAKLAKDDNFKVSVKNDGTIPEEYIKKGSGYFWDVILDELRQNFVTLPFDEAFEKLKQWEDYSVTSYCVLIKKIPFPVVKWWEVMESRTGLFDQSLTETVLASLVFMDPNTKDPEWKCFEFVSFIYLNLFSSFTFISAAVPKLSTKRWSSGSPPSPNSTCGPLLSRRATMANH